MLLELDVEPLKFFVLPLFEVDDDFIVVNICILMSLSSINLLRDGDKSMRSSTEHKSSPTNWATSLTLVVVVVQEEEEEEDEADDELRDFLVAQTDDEDEDEQEEEDADDWWRVERETREEILAFNAVEDLGPRSINVCVLRLKYTDWNE